MEEIRDPRSTKLAPIKNQTYREESKSSSIRSSPVSTALRRLTDGDDSDNDGFFDFERLNLDDPLRPSITLLYCLTDDVIGVDLALPDDDDDEEELRRRIRRG